MKNTKTTKCCICGTEHGIFMLSSLYCGTVCSDKKCLSQADIVIDWAKKTYDIIPKNASKDNKTHIVKKTLLVKSYLIKRLHIPKMRINIYAVM